MRGCNFCCPEALQHVSLLYNGNFATPPVGLAIRLADHARIRRLRSISCRNPACDGQHALAMDFLYGRVDYHSVNELVLLAPGTYHFEGQYKAS